MLNDRLKKLHSQYFFIFGASKTTFWFCGFWWEGCCHFKLQKITCTKKWEAIEAYTLLYIYYFWGITLINKIKFSEEFCTISVKEFSVIKFGARPPIKHTSFLTYSFTFLFGVTILIGDAIRVNPLIAIVEAWYIFI